MDTFQSFLETSEKKRSVKYEKFKLNLYTHHNVIHENKKLFTNTADLW